MATTRIWNITDSASAEVPSAPQNLRILGKLVVPGRFVEVEEKALKLAHKIHADVGRGLLFIGKKAPAAYVKAKKPPRAKLPAGAARQGLAHNRSAKVVLGDSVKVADEAVVGEGWA